MRPAASVLPASVHDTVGIIGRRCHGSVSPRSGIQMKAAHGNSVSLEPSPWSPAPYAQGVFGAELLSRRSCVAEVDTLETRHIGWLQHPRAAGNYADQLAYRLWAEQGKRGADLPRVGITGKSGLNHKRSYAEFRIWVFHVSAVGQDSSAFRADW